MSRSRASARLRSCVRLVLRHQHQHALLGDRLPARRIRRIATLFGSEGERRTSKRNWVSAVESLLTFCPPPGLRGAHKAFLDFARSSMLMVSVTRIMRSSCPAL